MSTLYLLITLLLSSVGFFLSAWIVIPAPIFSLLVLSVGTPEVSPWLWGVNLLGGLFSLGWLLLKGSVFGSITSSMNSSVNSSIAILALSLSIFGLAFSLLPIGQLPSTVQKAEAEMIRAISPNYRAAVPPELQRLFRPQPFSALAAWRGIKSINKKPIRYTASIPIPNPAGVSLTLALYRPPQEGIYPAIVIIHGGAWREGSPQDNTEFSRYMAAQGYAVWAITYRYAPAHRFPTQLQDVRTALEFIHSRGGDYETDVERIAIMGRSAGAQLAMLAAYSPEFATGSPAIKAVVNYYGPVDLEAGYYDLPNPDPIDSRAVLLDFLGGTPEEVGELYRAASPINFVKGSNSYSSGNNSGNSSGASDRSLPPSLLIYGGKDHIVMAKFGKALADQIKARGDRAVFLKIPWADHAFDAVFSGISNQLALYYTERFLAFYLHRP
ncbi:MAG: alpha/beta hydrolase [Coleofasciculaceae cyanobacterium SM2_1_6]|nr:alpha/beta hydrolase [Coleofasciculaceae cyanobacterium SM2_1_6]